MLIRNAEIMGHGLADLRVVGHTIMAIGALSPEAGEPVIEARHGALLPGLHDHHIHLAGLAVRSDSVWCGPPEVTNAESLAAKLDLPGTGWIRAIGYHESVLGELPDTSALDRLVAHRPLRMQHCSGRMWMFNSAGLFKLLSHVQPSPSLERKGRRFTGRLFDDDPWLREALSSTPPDLSAASSKLARFGVTGLTDMSPRNDPGMASHFTSQMANGALVQHCLLAGALELANAESDSWRLGPAKLHLHEAALPNFTNAVRFIAEAHNQCRPVAIHCVTEVELVFALAAIKEAGTHAGDRIEHASITSPELVEQIAKQDLSVCTQPHFVAERGDRYLKEVEPRHRRDLYRLQSLRQAGIGLGAGSDAPFGSADPWKAMAAAVSRETHDGRTIGRNESLSPEEALGLYLKAPDDLSRQRRVSVGEAADLCLLDRPWAQARKRLTNVDVAATIVSGRLVYDPVDQSPFESTARA